eukprot:CAMPEP_0185318594 /NCGR_PEP_ID=MMETSP1363-20130426/49973_1 /TAXON_ID=38817 /ORGANISM="Gephyrocapsa oceanica, Strain RCC1303" /LENGTH=384 /DNA_ID=CAMNT_0027916899 /DNA_START=34 /DNA_END=1187 /DNA_ORIENTATION=+
MKTLAAVLAIVVAATNRLGAASKPATVHEPAAAPPPAPIPSPPPQWPPSPPFSPSSPPTTSGAMATLEVGGGGAKNIANADAHLLQRVGHAANRAEDYPLARAAFLFVAKLTGRSEARASAANMALREAARCGSEWLANVAHEELDRVLSLPNLAPSIASVCQAKRQEAEKTRDRLAEEAAERGEASVARHSCADEPDGARKRKRSGAVARLPCDEAALQPPRCEAPLSETAVLVNRSPVLTLWAACVAQRLGHDWAASLSLATALAAMFARTKGRSLGLPQPATNKFDAATQSVDLLGEAVPALYTSRGLRGLTLPRSATGDDSAPEPASPLQAQRSLSAAFGARFGEAYTKLANLAAALPRRALVAHGNRRAYEMYCLFRPH